MSSTYSEHRPKGGKPFHDREFRRALAWATDKEKTISITLKGRGDPANHTVAPANKTWYWDDTSHAGGDLDKAKQILKDAGYRWDENGNLLMPVERMNKLAEEDQKVKNEMGVEWPNCNT
jgi:peptide/nickel transport system substrate-binding protein